jgi:peptidoglycan/LPS O-acetylase OafA/YrhL
VADFLIGNLTLLAGAVFYLPGVFEANPFPRAVNASLWTLTYELRMYLILLLVGLVAALLPRERGRVRMVKAFVLLMAGVALVAHLVNHFGIQENEHSTRLYLMFFAGAACQVLKEKIQLSLPLFLCAASALVLSGPYESLFFIVYNLLLSYILLFLAYIPAGRIRLFNRLGDYSYGSYLYAFPVQQSVAALIPGVSLWGMMLVSAVVSLILAILSWHLLEKPALRFKPHPMATK